MTASKTKTNYSTNVGLLKIKLTNVLLKRDCLRFMFLNYESAFISPFKM